MYTDNNTNFLRMNIQKVLPLVYDESLSYYETLGRLTEYINTVVKRLDEETKTAFLNTLNGYFNTLMPNVIYDDAEEKITLMFVPVVGDEVHSYTANNDTLNIMGV